MAEARVSVNLNEFNCCICLDLLMDPVTIHCGHSFCRTCIKEKWDYDEALGEVYSCPLCKKTFTPRPDLVRNIMLAEMVEKLRNTHIADRSLAGPEDVECDVCVGQKYQAVKSCLVCLASYCETHFNLHNELNPGNKHKVIDAREKLTDRICSDHKKILDVLCCTEQDFVCTECAMRKCKNHETITFAYARFNQEKQVEIIIKQTYQRAQEVKNRMKDLRKSTQSIKSSAKEILDLSEKTFAKLISSIEEKRSEVRNRIKVMEQAEVGRAEEIHKLLEKELAELKRKEDKLVQLAQLDDFAFLKTTKDLFDFSTLENVPDISVSMSAFKDLQNTVSNITKNMNHFWVKELGSLFRTGKTVHVVQTSYPMIKEDFLPYFCELTVDPRTASHHLRLTKDKQSIYNIANSTSVEQSLASTLAPVIIYDRTNSERFTYFAQALCCQALQDRCYWEVEWNGQQVYIAVSYKGVDRKGCCSSVGFGYNDRSWSLCCNPSQYVFYHNFKETVIPVPVSTRVGIYLDHQKGTLSFYRITDTMTLLYRVHTTFKEPVYPAFWVFDDSYVKICGHIEKVISQLVYKKVENRFNTFQLHLDDWLKGYCKKSTYGIYQSIYS